MRWRILALLFFARIALGFQFQTLASVGDGLVVAFGLDYAGIGLLIGLFCGLLYTSSSPRDRTRYRLPSSA